MKAIKNCNLIFKILFHVTFFIMVVLLIASPILLGNASQINSLLGIETQIGSGGAEGNMYYNTKFKTMAEVHNASLDIIEEAMKEGAVLLQNKEVTYNDGQNQVTEPALPLSSGDSVRLYGAASYYSVHMGQGSGGVESGVIPSRRVSLYDGLTGAGLSVDETMNSWYRDNGKDSVSGKSGNNDRDGESFMGASNQTSQYPVKDVAWNSLHANKSAEADAAVMVIGRNSGEALDLYMDVTMKGGVEPLDAVLGRASSSNYTSDEFGDALSLAANELDVLNNLVQLKSSGTIKKVIVLMNTANPMQCQFLEDIPGIDACMWIGNIGENGATAIGKLLTGEYNPSGRTVNTFWEESAYNPVYYNFGSIRYGNAGILENYFQTEGFMNNEYYVAYQEGIYNGYKYTETRYEDYVTQSGNAGTFDYGEVVTFPFGHGLSYTTFSYSDFSVAYDADTDVYTVSVTVTNTGDVAGKDVVQLYTSPQYYDGETEKSAINLTAFAKTDTLYPAGYDVPDGEDAADYPNSQTLTLTFDIYDMASYDSYDMNGNGFKGWELDPGDYGIKFMKNAHDASGIPDVTVRVPVTDEETGRGYIYRFDPETNGYVKNRFTGDDAEAGVPTDGSAFGEEVKYLSRADFAGTFPVSKTPNRPAGSLTSVKDWYYTGWDEDPSLERPRLERTDGELLYLYTREDGSPATAEELAGTQGVKLVANETLILKLGADYDAPEWEQLLTQLTMDEINLITGSAGFGTKEAASVGKPRLLDFDGPSGFNSKITQSTSSTAWTGYPAASVLAQTWNVSLAYGMGFALGAEAKVTGGMTGIYAPTVNLHRTPYNTRNYEAYSEDPVISGYMAANMITGAKNNGLTCWLKHFALSEAGWNPNHVYTWLTEQNLRENYLKPFEIAVKDADANAVMSAFNRVGGVDCVNSYALLTKVLRDEWKFEGAVVTDYNMGELREHIRSGNDLHLTPNENTPQTLDKLDDTDVYGACFVRRAVRMVGASARSAERACRSRTRIQRVPHVPSAPKQRKESVAG